MALQVFKLHDGSLETAGEMPWPLEKEMQGLSERNLQALFGLQFVDTEVPLKGFRLDTLAFDLEANCFVIIEYKRGSNNSVIDQGFAYLNLVLNNEAFFVLRYNKKFNASFGEEDIDWKKTRVYFVAPDFTRYQREAVNFRDLPFDLWELSRFSSDTVILSHVGGDAGAQVATGIPFGDDTKGVVVAPSPERHLEGRPPEIRELYARLRQGILSFDSDVQERAIIVAILFEYEGSRFAEVVVQKKQLVVHFDYFNGESRGLAVRNLQAEGTGKYFAVGWYQVKVKPGDDLDPVLDLLRGSLDGLKAALRP